MTDVKPIPEGYPRVTPYLCVDGAAEAIDFYVDVLGAVEPGGRFTDSDGRIGHAELHLGDSVVMLSDAYPEIGFVSPKTIGGTPVLLYVYVEDVDAVVERAVQAGATLRREVEDQFYGDRTGEIEDPFGHRWHLATHVADVTPEDMAERGAEAAET